MDLLLTILFGLLLGLTLAASCEAWLRFSPRWHPLLLGCSFAALALLLVLLIHFTHPTDLSALALCLVALVAGTLAIFTTRLAARASVA